MSLVWSGLQTKNKTNLIGWNLAFTGFYDGVGLSNYDAFGGSAKLTIPLK